MSTVLTEKTKSPTEQSSILHIYSYDNLDKALCGAEVKHLDVEGEADCVVCWDIWHATYEPIGWVFYG